MFKVLPSPFSAAGPRVNPFFRRSSILKSTEIYVAQCYRSQSSVNPAIFSRLLLENTTIYLIAFSDYIYNKLIVSVLFDKCLLSRENMEISYFFTGFWMEQHLVLLSRVNHKFLKKLYQPYFSARLCIINSCAARLYTTTSYSSPASLSRLSTDNPSASPLFVGYLYGWPLISTNANRSTEISHCNRQTHRRPALSHTNSRGKKHDSNAIHSALRPPQSSSFYTTAHIHKRRAHQTFGRDVNIFILSVSGVAQRFRIPCISQSAVKIRRADALLHKRVDLINQGRDYQGNAAHHQSRHLIAKQLSRACGH